MSITAPTLITALPVPPSTASPADFDSKADAFLGGLPTLRTEVNNISTVNYNNALDAATSATAAATQASVATAQASAASISASNAAASAGAAQWVSGTTYAIGAAAWSPITFSVYRRLTAGAGTTDPSADATNWGAMAVGVLAGVYKDKVTAIAASTATTAIDLRLSNSYVITISASTTISFTNPPAGTDITSFTLITVNNATGGYAISWPASVTWAGGATPARTTTANKSDAYTFFTRDAGTKYVGSLAVKDY